MRIEDRRRAPAATPPGGAPPLPDVPGADALPAPLRSAGLILLALYFCLLGWLALRQVPTAWAYDTNLTPFASVHRILATGGLRQLLAAPALTAPLGVLLPVAGGRLRTAWFPSFLHAVGSSAMIATAFEVLRTGLAGQVLNVDDILLGVIGAGLAHLLLVPAGRAALRARQVLRATPEPNPEIRIARPGETPGSRIGIRADA
ncbi:VanZ family protein [Kitasatospora azatica]|uniref:VanZ family protein n=1 Tax=Kitasatospora azatica TaxID=58347 RepID=UPI00068BC0DE|nr:VanZ family protein [Kitasatospora azatica]